VTTSLAPKPQLDPEFAQPTAMIPATPMGLLQLALEKEANIDVIERLAKLQREEREAAAKVAFEESMTRCQRRMRRISADATNPQTRSKYASYAQLDREIRPIFTDEGFALSFGTGEATLPDMILVTCHVSHSQGYGREYQIPMPADGKGAKGGDVMTKTHATGAAVTYGMRYLLKMIFNVAIGEDDNDGNGPAVAITEKQEAELLDYADALRQCDTLPQLKAIFADAYKFAGAVSPQAKTNMARVYEECKRRFLK